MKLVFTFFLFLCCYLPGRHGYAHQSSHDFNSCCPHARDAQKKNVDAFAAIQDYDITGGGSLAGEYGDLLYIEGEVDEYVLKNHVSRYVSAFTRVFFSSRHTCPSGFFCRYLSYRDYCKYIAQRVLRI